MRNLSRQMIGLLLGAAMLAPVASQAQERPRYRGDAQGGGRERAAMMNGDSRREAVQQSREAPRAVEPRAVERAAPPARVDRSSEVRRERADPARNLGDRGARGYDPSRRAVAPTVEMRRDGVDRRDGDRDRNRGENRADRDRNWDRSGRNDGNRSWTNDRRNWNGRDADRRDNRNWDRNWRDDQRYGWQDYRRTNRNVYRLPRYEGRYGYSYRRWSPGYRFDPFYYGSSYWINDPFYYRLPPAYGDYRWVRYYDDAALVDIRTGEIIDIIYSFFF